MKDIYDLLKEVQVDEDELYALESEDIEVTELEKERLKKALRKKIRKNNGWKNKGLVAAILIVLLITPMIYIGIAAPAYAADIPIVGDIFRFLDNGRTGIYDLYKENANEINVTKENRGISITLKDAIFDGKTITYTYQVNSDKDLGDFPHMGPGIPLSIKDYHRGFTGSSMIKKVGEGTYLGQDSMTIFEEKDTVQCKLHFKQVMTEKKDQIIKGDWKFEFQLKAVQGEKQNVNKSTEKEGFTVTINSINKTNMSVVVDYTQKVPEEYRREWDNVTTRLDVKDDLGNVYRGEDNGGEGNVDMGILNGSSTFAKINEKATKLIITPKIFCSTNGGGVSFDERGKEIELKPEEVKEDRNIVMEDIIVELK